MHNAVDQLLPDFSGDCGVLQILPLFHQYPSNRGKYSSPQAPPCRHAGMRLLMVVDALLENGLELYHALAAQDTCY